MLNVLMVIKTTGLSYDDRLRKQCETLIGLGEKIEICVLEDANQLHNGLTEKGVPFRAISLFTRKILPHKKGLIFKTLEMYVRFARMVFHIKPNILWLHNIEMAGLVPFGWVMKKTGVIKKLVWDQHELPPEKVLNHKILRYIFMLLLRLSDIIVFANNERRELLLERLGNNYGNSFKVIENFVDNQFIMLPRGSLPHEVEDWLGGQSYILAQGGANPGRYLEEVIVAMMDIKDIKLIVVGPFEMEKVSSLRLQYHKNLYKKVFFTGMVPQLELVNYIDNALASIVLYNADQMNSYLCAPNRLYHALSRGVPAIVGSNPPMKSLVEKLKCGVVLQYDGRDVVDIRNGIYSVLESYADYREKAVEQKWAVTWESQKMTIGSIVGWGAGGLP